VSGVEDSGKCQTSTAGPKKMNEMRMTFWNCRGLADSLPYLNSLISQGLKILVISEH